LRHQHRRKPWSVLSPNALLLGLSIEF
jgi:hypothetical protein